MPSAIAFQSSSSLGLKTVIAIIAMTTRIPTKIAYSVVPWPPVSDSFAYVLAHRPWVADRRRSAAPSTRLRTRLAAQRNLPGLSFCFHPCIQPSLSFSLLISIASACPRSDASFHEIQHHRSQYQEEHRRKDERAYGQHHLHWCFRDALLALGLVLIPGLLGLIR